jgi:hypothetical protein
MPVVCLVSDVCPSNGCSIGSNLRFVIVWELRHATVKQEFKLVLQGVIVFQVKLDLLICNLKEVWLTC